MNCLLWTHCSTSLPGAPNPAHAKHETVSVWSVWCLRGAGWLSPHMCVLICRRALPVRAGQGGSAGQPLGGGHQVRGLPQATRGAPLSTALGTARCSSSCTMPATAALVATLSCLSAQIAGSACPQDMLGFCLENDNAAGLHNFFGGVTRSAACIRPQQCAQPKVPAGTVMPSTQWSTLAASAASSLRQF